MHIGATLGIATGSILTILYVADGYKKDGGSGALRRTVEAFSGWNPEDGTWKAQRMRFTIPVAAGCSATAVAVKTGVNRWTPKGINI